MAKRSSGLLEEWLSSKHKREIVVSPGGKSVAQVKGAGQAFKEQQLKGGEEEKRLTQKGVNGKIVQGNLAVRFFHKKKSFKKRVLRTKSRTEGLRSDITHSPEEGGLAVHVLKTLFNSGRLVVGQGNDFAPSVKHGYLRENVQCTKEEEESKRGEKR